MKDFASAIAANRFGLGARPGELDRIAGDPRGWLAAQLEPPAPTLSGAGLRSAAGVLAETLARRRADRAKRLGRTAEDPPGAEGRSSEARPGADASEERDPARTAARGGSARAAYAAEVDARFRHAVATDRPFLERLTQFWTNHFAVSVDKPAVLGLAGAFEREAIRPHVLGDFADLLLAVERHPAMLIYLDNYRSIGPNSSIGRRAARAGRDVGRNENLAREILELHTLGVRSGYTQEDVIALANVLTGWSVVGPAAGRFRPETHRPGEFAFRSEMHEPGAQRILGRRYAEDGEAQGVAVLRDLAAHPSTAEFLATKLARHFVADDPPRDVVGRLAAAFAETGGHLPAVYRELIGAPAAWREPFAKYKTPNDYVFSVFRALDSPIDAGRGTAALTLLGQRPYAPGSPAGWPDRSADWDAPSALLKRIEWAGALAGRVGGRYDAAELAEQLLGATLSEETRRAVAGAATRPQALTLLLASPELLRR
ncbi:MAG TPA: DUF1800 domain-containing protein [Gammaproteobacteria bacterium]